MKSEHHNRIEVTSQAQPDVQRFILWPNRSLPDHGKMVLLTVIAAGLAIPIFFVSSAMVWYLIVPAGVTFLGMILALWSNERAGKFREIVEVSERMLQRTIPTGPD